MKKFLLVLTLLQASSAAAQFESGNDLYRYCSEDEGSFYSGVCSGYVIGVYDSKSDEFCIPQGVSKGQVRAILVDFLEDNPQHRHLTAESLVGASIVAAFPCR